METIKRTKIAKRILISMMTLILIVSCILAMKQIKEDDSIIANQELLRAMTYEQFEDGDENVEGTDNVKFSAFFLRDLDGDGYAEKIKGTCKEIGTEDTLYMEINVQTSGYLKDGKIEINGKNFYLQTSMPKDQELKSSYIGNNIKIIEFENLFNGTQKMLTGIVRSGDYSYPSKKTEAIGNNINNYSKQDNAITLTGVFVDEDGNEREINKSINLEMDWYGTTKTLIKNTYQNYTNLSSRIDYEAGTINLDFIINTSETDEMLLIKQNRVEVTIPKYNDCLPKEILVKTSNVEYSYDENTSVLEIERVATVSDDGTIIRSVPRVNQYEISVKYPIEAYLEQGEETVELLVPIEEFYEGYNNLSTEFNNPYKSNVAKSIIRSIYNKYVPSPGTPTTITPTVVKDSASIIVGKYISNPYKDYVISKEKPINIYNGISTKENDDIYTVSWKYNRGNEGSNEVVVLKETPNGQAQKVDEFLDVSAHYISMEKVTTNKGIYFSNLTGVISSDGEIKIYDEETGYLLVTFTKDGRNGTESWENYNSSNIYNYESLVKHIRVEITGIQNNSSLNVFNVKVLDDELITERYTLDEFSNFKQIKSNLVVYRGDSLIENTSKNALYEIPVSIAKIDINKKNLSTQITEKNEKIVITAEYNENMNENGWINAIFLVKIPEEILDVKINSVTVNNIQIRIDSYEVINSEQGRFIKIYTNNSNPEGYQISIDCEFTPDPRISTTTGLIELYAINEDATDYYYKSQDIYDINGNSNLEERVNKWSTSISLIAPNSLLTSQSASEFDDTGITIIAPEVVDLKPIYDEEDTKKQTVKIGVQFRNNYSSTISEVLILGKIPFEGNTSVISKKDMNSQFSTTIKPFEIENGILNGIEVPDELKDKITIYYSDNENPSKDINDEDNRWILGEDVSDWKKIKTYLIDFGSNRIEQGKGYTFNYTIELPIEVDFNKIAYSHHGIYFSLDTEAGKYRTKTEPNKIGIRIAEKYDLLLTKYQKNLDKLIPGATYRVSKLDNNGDVVENKTAITNSYGLFELSNLYAENEYIIEEVRTPEDYELNTDILKIVGHVNRQSGELTVERIQGDIRDEIEVIKNDQDKYKVHINVEDEVKAKLHLIKVEKETEEPIKNVLFKIKGKGYSNNGKIIVTDSNGEINTSGLTINEEYSLEEIKAEGYYLPSLIRFKIVNNNGTYEVENIAGTIKTNSVILNDGIPEVVLKLENEKIPTYDLKINKIEKGSRTTDNPNGTPVRGAKFKLFKEGKEIGAYETDDGGQVLINGLYKFEAEKNINQTYILKEIYAPEGYSKTRDLIFMVSNESGVVNYQEILEDGQEARDYTINENMVEVTIEDCQSFKLTKKDGETDQILPNTKFAIYNISNDEVPAKNSKGEIIGKKEIINSQEYFIMETNERGEIAEDLPEGLYKAVEVSANHEKYDLSKNVIYFGIGESKEGKQGYEARWANSIGDSNDNYINSICQLINGKYVAVGYSKIGNSSYNNGFISIYYNDGKIEKSAEIGDGRSVTEISDVSETPDGGFIIGGKFTAKNLAIGDGKTLNKKGSSNDSDGFLIKYDSNEEIEWIEVFGGSKGKTVDKVLTTKDGGFIALGSFYEDINIGGELISKKGLVDIFLVKYNINKEIEWTQTIGNSGLAYKIHSITESSNNEIIVAGVSNTSQYFSFNRHDGIIMKFNQLGEQIWETKVGGGRDDYIHCVTGTADGGFVVGGTYYSERITIGNQTFYNNSNGYGMAIKYNSTGTVTWATTYNDFSPYSVTTSKEGGFILAGGYGGNGGNGIVLGDYHLMNNGNDGMIVKYGVNNNVDWAALLGDTGNDRISSIIENNEGQIIVGGYFSSTFKVGDYKLINNGKLDAMLVEYEKIDISDPSIKWQKEIVNEAKDIIESKDGGYIVSGNRKNF